MSTNAKNSAVTFNGKITSIEVVPQYGETRVMIGTDQSFESFDKEGTKTTTNTFGASHKKIFNATCANKVFNLIKAMRVGRPVAPEVLGLLLADAEIEFTRELHAAGDVVDGKTLDSDTYVTTIVNLKLNCKDFEKIILEMRADWFPKTTAPAVALNPFA